MEMAVTDFLPDREKADYAPLYCEENVFRFLGQARDRGIRSWGLFISNPDRSVAVACQKSGEEGIAVWDYHVVAVVAPAPAAAPANVDSGKKGTGRIFPLVFDLDSALPYPCPLDRYLGLSFPSGWPRRFAPLFRFLPASEFLSALVSDRSHMRDSSGNWIAPPPVWPAPGEGSGRIPTLMDLVDMEKPGPGLVFGLGALADPAVWE